MLKFLDFVLFLIASTVFLSTTPAIAQDSSGKKLLEFLSPLNGSWEGEGYTIRHYITKHSETYNAEVTLNMSKTPSEFYKFQHLAKLTYKTPDFAKGMCTLSKNIEGRWKDSDYYIDPLNAFKNFLPPDGTPLTVVQFSPNQLQIRWGSEFTQYTKNPQGTRLQVIHFYLNPQNGALAVEDGLALRKVSQKLETLACPLKDSQNQLVIEFSEPGGFIPHVSTSTGQPLATYYQNQIYGYDLVPQKIVTRHLLTGQVVSATELSGLPRMLCDLSVLEANQNLYGVTCSAKEILVFDLSTSQVAIRWPITTNNSHNQTFHNFLRMITHNNQTLVVIPEFDGSQNYISTFDIHTGQVISKIPFAKGHFLFGEVTLTSTPEGLLGIALTGTNRSIKATKYYLHTANLSTGKPLVSAVYQSGGPQPTLPEKLAFTYNQMALPMFNFQSSCLFFMNPSSLNPVSSQCLPHAHYPEFIQYTDQIVAIDYTKEQLRLFSLNQFKNIGQVVLSPRMAKDKMARPKFFVLASGLYSTYYPETLRDPRPIVNLSTGQHYPLHLNPFTEAVVEVFDHVRATYGVTRDRESGLVRVFQLR